MSDANHDPLVTRYFDIAGNEVNILTGRTKVPLSKKLNPLWWFQNDLEPVAPPWYKSGQPDWWRTFSFNYLRNPLSNFSAYVVGVKDRNYTIHGTFPVDSGTPADIGKTGWKWSVIDVGWLKLPFVGYASKRILFYAGWAWEGNLGAKFVIRDTGLPSA